MYEKFMHVRGQLVEGEITERTLHEFDRLRLGSEELWRSNEKSKKEIEELRANLGKSEKEGKKERREKRKKTETVEELKEEMKRNAEMYQSKVARLLKES